MPEVGGQCQVTAELSESCGCLPEVAPLRWRQMKHTKGRRLRAARALRGYSHETLADKLGLVNFGERTIREVERGARPLYDHERDAVAKLIKISPAFFEVDLEHIGEAITDPQLAAEDLAQAALEAAQGLLRDAAAKRASPGGPDHPAEEEEGDGE